MSDASDGDLDHASIPDWEYAYRALLQKNYLPARSWYREEIPPCFSTEEFTPGVADILLDEIQVRQHGPIAYRLARQANSTRLLAIPHPVVYARLCRALVEHWDEVMGLIDENKESRIVPKRYDDDHLIAFGRYEGDEESAETPRLVIQRHPPAQRRAVAERVDLAIGKRYLVTADIASFFPSMYTHAIPWAIHGKEEAKRRRTDTSLYGNVIDKCSRDMQRGETVGIPVGPGTSHLLSELVLHPVDKYLRNQEYAFVRFIDDYHCYCESRQRADAFIIDLENQLAKYNLQLNSAKTTITRLPAMQDDPWVVQLRTQLSEVEVSISTLGSFFDLATALQAKWRDKNVVKYAVRTLAGKSTEDDQIDQCARHVLGLVFHYPSVMPILAELVQKRPAAVDIEELEELLLRQVDEQMPSDAVCWALFTWRLRVIGGRKLPSELIERIIDRGDCMPIAMLWAIGQAEEEIIGFITGLEPGRSNWGYDQYWLLIHEVGDGVARTKDYRESTGLALLAEQNVSFIDESVFVHTEFGEFFEPM